MTRVIVAAASASLRERLRTLAREPAVEIAGETGEAARAHTLATRADVLLVWGAALLAQIAGALDPEAGDDANLDRELSSYAIVTVTNDRRAVETLETLPVRGWAIVLEDASSEELAAAIAAAGAGLGAMPVAWTARVRQRARDWNDAAVVDERLTSREQEVLDWLSQGLSNRRIAERLGISEHTVKFHVTAIYGKLGASTRTEAVNRALRRGWLRL